MTLDDELESALHPDDLGSIGEQDTAPVDPARMAAPEIAPAIAPPIAPTIAPQPAAQTPFDAPKPPGLTTKKVTLSPAETENLGALDANTQARKDTVEQEGNLAVDKAVDRAAQAQAEADLKEQQAQQVADQQAQQRKLIEERQHRDEAEYAKYREMGLKDPDAGKGFLNRVGAALAIGLGQYSAAMNHTENQAARIFEQARRENLELQKANIEKQREASIRAGKDVEQAKAEAAEALHNLQIKNVAQIDAFRAKFAAESERMGIPAARIQASKTMQELERQALEAREKHLESTRTFSRDLTPKELRAGKGGGGGGGAGGGSLSAREKLNEYATRNPGDSAGLYRLAGTLGFKSDKDAVSAVTDAIKNSKAPEGQQKHAAAGATMLRGISTLEKLHAKGYQPTEKDWLKWQKNQDDVQLSKANAEKGNRAGAMFERGLQTVGLSAKTEYDGLSDDTRAYFENVKRILESVGREQSGAAISRNEWDNFGGQYGLQASGGLAAAKEYARDRMTLSGVAGRQVEAAGGVPKAAPAPAASGGDKSEAERAKALLADPRAQNLSPAKRAYLTKLARGAQ